MTSKDTENQGPNQKPVAPGTTSANSSSNAAAGATGAVMPPKAPPASKSSTAVDAKKTRNVSSSSYHYHHPHHAHHHAAYKYPPYGMPYPMGMPHALGSSTGAGYPPPPGFPPYPYMHPYGAYYPPFPTSSTSGAPSSSNKSQKTNSTSNKPQGRPPPHPKPVLPPGKSSTASTVTSGMDANTAGYYSRQALSKPASTGSTYAQASSNGNSAAESLDSSSLSSSSWSKEEDDKLKQLSQELKSDWALIASKMPGRTDNQCKSRYSRLSRTPTIVNKAPWTAEEDQRLRRLVEQFGDTNWTLVSNRVPNRNSKQCRDRWQNFLNPNLRKHAWTAEEDRIILKSHLEIGNKWVEMSKRLPGRYVLAENSSCGRFIASLF